jgi:hypothetical protein
MIGAKSRTLRQFGQEVGLRLRGIVPFRGRSEADRAGIGDPEALKRLPEDEQKAPRAFSTEVAVLLTQAEKS